MWRTLLPPMHSLRFRKKKNSESQAHGISHSEAENLAASKGLLWPSASLNFWNRLCRISRGFSVKNVLSWKNIPLPSVRLYGMWNDPSLQLEEAKTLHLKFAAVMEAVHQFTRQKVHFHGPLCPEAGCEKSSHDNNPFSRLHSSGRAHKSWHSAPSNLRSSPCPTLVPHRLGSHLTKLRFFFFLMNETKKKHPFLCSSLQP